MKMRLLIESTLNSVMFENQDNKAHGKTHDYYIVLVLIFTVSVHISDVMNQIPLCLER
jgi:hypothetical protein